MTQRAFRSTNRFMRSILTLLVVWIFNLYSVQVSASSPDGFGGVKMSFVQTDSEQAQNVPGAFPGWYRLMMTQWLSHEPYSILKVKSSNCEPRSLEKLLRDPRLKDIRLQAAVMRRHLRLCQEEIEKPKKASWRHTFDSLRYRYQTDSNQLFQQVLFELPGGVKVRGLFALKRDARPRPFVILRLGIFSSVTEFMAERPLVIQLFDQSPFHLLILENSTSGEFIQNNLRLSIGGYDEGIQNLMISRYLRSTQNPISKRIASLHFVGVSLGGHGVLHAGLLNDAEKQKVIDSMLLFCPVVQLKATFDQLQSSRWRAPLINFWSSRRLVGLQKRSERNLSVWNFLPEAFEFFDSHYQGPLIAYEVSDQTPGASSDFWELNSFHKRLGQLKTPTLSFVTSQDQLVPKEINSNLIQSSHFEKVEFPQGEHCSLSSAYDWQTMLSFIRGHILSQSTKSQLQEVEIPLGKVQTIDQEIRFVISRIAESPHLLKLQIYGIDPLPEVHLALSQFGYGSLKTPLTESEFALLQRGLPGLIQVVKKNSHLSLIWEK